MLVVLTHAPTEKVCGPGIELTLAAGTLLLVPGNREARSPSRAPLAPRSTSLASVRSLAPAQSYPIVPLGSPSGQYAVAPSCATAVRYGLLATEPSGTVMLVAAVGPPLP